ncbi:27127_t:CDS:2 [Dentiscutata erythropus]|uniref:27127_t:CDS:1 n=1 Tax=Dentiscutata erythropus TaxID=1348616 RepID=A0A9N9BB24_9GLOM|nr:27127_t:CDS:2 [Dentiscutata erythropus]
MSVSPLGVTLTTPSGVLPSVPSSVASFVSLDVTSTALSGAMFITTPCAVALL